MPTFTLVDNSASERADSPQQSPLIPNPTIPTDQALAHAANLIGCANQLALDVAIGETGRHAAWAAHYLSDMAKIIIDEALDSLALMSAAKDQ